MDINFDNLSGKKKEIYESLWGNMKFSAEVSLTGKTDYSYEFSNATKNATKAVSDKLSDIFELRDKSLFENKFAMVCSGNGGELKNMTTLHSSALCALLFFYNMTEKNKLTFATMELNDIIFYDSIFEFKNKVIGGCYPSNVDVVLIGEYKKSGKKVLFFLESKFSEYILGITKANSKYEIGKSYFNNCYTKCIYKEDVLKKINIDLDISKDKHHLVPREDKYIEGIKQIVSHYVGIRNLIDKKFCEKNDEDVLEKVKDVLKSNPKILLGEIVFDNFSAQVQDKLLNSYEKDYKLIAEKLNEIDKDLNDIDKRITVLKKPLRYSMFKEVDFKLDEKVSKYYSLNKAST